jgi:hypothetical protein
MGTETAVSAEAVIDSVTALLQGLCRYGSAIGQSLSVLRVGVAQCDWHMRVVALEVLRGLDIELQESVDDEELAAVDLLVEVGGDAERRCSERSLAFLALVTLANRHRKTYIKAGTDLQPAVYDAATTWTFANMAFVSVFYLTHYVLP